MVTERHPEAPPAADATEAWRLMRQLTHRPEILGRVRSVAEEAGVSPTLVKALTSLSAEHPTPMREMAGALRCDASYVTTVVDGLEEHGLAHRTPHPTDRRVKVVSLTPEGLALAARARAALDEPPAALAALPADEVATLVETLRRISR